MPKHGLESPPHTPRLSMITTDAPPCPSLNATLVPKRPAPMTTTSALATLAIREARPPGCPPEALEQRLELVVACEVSARCEDADGDPAVAHGEEVRAFLVLVGEGAVRRETVRKEVEVAGSAMS